MVNASQQSRGPVARAVAVFREAFGADPAAVASAPGRINLIGEHIDYHGGHVLPAATLERTAVAVGPLAGRFRAVSEDPAAYPATDRVWPPSRAGDWGDYVAGSALVAATATGWHGGVALAVASDVPVGAGISSSAAIEVATITALLAAAGRTLPPLDIAKLGHDAEANFVGMPCGMMDQTASACAPPRQAILLDCATLTWSAVDVPVDLVLADSGERHNLRDSGYAERRREGDAAMALIRGRHPAIVNMVDIPPAQLPELLKLLPRPLDLRVRHVVNENQRVLLAARALEAGDPEAFGVLVNATHASLRDLYECSTPRIDAIAEAARGLPHVLGARLVGAGWGGAVLVVCRAGSGGAVAARLRGDAALALPDVRHVQLGGGAKVE